jgi:hypothetical protein
LKSHLIDKISSILEVYCSLVFRCLKQDNIGMKQSDKGSILGVLRDNYLESKYQDGIDLIKKNKHKFSPSIYYYNLGTLYAKKNELIKAKVYLEKGLHNGGNSGELVHNLNFINSKLDTYTEVSIKENLMFNALSIPNVNYLTVYLLMILISLLWVKKRILKTKILVSITHIVLIVTFYFCMSPLNYGIALKEINVYEGPSAVFSEVVRVAPGEKLIISKSQDGWHYIEFPNHLAGWIKEGTIELFRGKHGNI